MRAIILSLIAFLAVGLQTTTMLTSKNQYDWLKEEILQNFSEPAIQPLETKPDKNNCIQFPSYTITESVTYSALFSLLASGSYRYKPDVIDRKTISDLNLFFYDATRPHDTILETIYRGYSLNGKIAHGMEIAHPTDSIALLEERQAALHYLLRHPTLLKQLTPCFKQLASLEHDLYSLWNPDDFLYSEYIESTFYKGSFKKFAGNGVAFFLNTTNAKTI